jgi:hypothetical protein
VLTDCVEVTELVALISVLRVVPGDADDDQIIATAVESSNRSHHRYRN